MTIERISDYYTSILSLALGATLAMGCSFDGKISGSEPVVEPVRILEKQGTSVVGDVGDAALDYVFDQSGEIGLSATDEFTIKAKSVGSDGKNHVRLAQHYAGVPVFGQDVVVHSDNVRFISLAGSVAKNLDGFDVVPTIDEIDAMETGKANYLAGAKDPAAGAEYSRETAELVIFPVENRDMRLAWHVVFYTELQNGINPGLWNYFVDAKTGDILFQFNGIHTLSQASGPGGNPQVERQWVNELDVEDAGGGLFKMETSRLVTVDMQNRTSGPGVVVTGPLGNIGDPAANDAHGFAEITLNYLADEIGVDSIDENGFVIRSRVHYDVRFENAFWDGTQMTYGDGDTFFHPLSGDIDVVSHEINHGFTTFHSDLIYAQMSGGLNESFSDIAGTAVEFYHEGDSADFDLGRDIFQNGSALRFMCDPTADGRSIDHADDFNTGIGVHFSSGISNKAFCRTARRFASGSPDGTANRESVLRAAKAWYVANQSFWTRSTTFTQGCQGVVDAAKSLGYSNAEVQHLVDSWADVGVFCEGAVEPIDCDEVITAEQGEIVSPNFPAAYPNNVNHTFCIEPASGQVAELSFPEFETETNFDFVEVKDANGAQLSRTSGGVAPAPASSTKFVVVFTSDGSVTRPGFRATWSTGATQNERPTVAITAPTAGETVSGGVLVSAAASDPDNGVARVVFALPDGTEVESAQAPFQVEWDSATVADGEYEIVAQAFDELGAASDPASVAVIVRNELACVGGGFEAQGLPLQIPDNTPAGITSQLTVSGSGGIGRLQVSVDIQHTWRGDLVVGLTSPSGTQFTLLERNSGDSADNVVFTNELVSAFNGEPAAGVWTLSVSDNAGLDLGALNSWSLTIEGDCGGTGGWTASASPNMSTIDEGTACTTLAVSQSGDAADVKIDLAGRHDWREILSATLEHNGQTAEVFAVGTFPQDAGEFALVSQPVAGFTGSATGEWTLCITDTDAFGDTGILETWSVHD